MASPDYVLGLDLGPNSIGWALLSASFDDGEPTELGFLDTSKAGHPPMGVRVFEAGLANFDTAKEVSLALNRRTKRSMRRTLARRRARKEALKQALIAANLWPPNPEAERALLELDPYSLRAKGLDQPLTRHQLGRAIFHLAQRRGFKSNRKGGKSETAVERKKALEEMKRLREALAAKGARTLGEYLASIASQMRDVDALTGLPRVLLGELRLRSRQVRGDLFAEVPLRATRDMVHEELVALLAAQDRLAALRLSGPHKDAILDAILFQHDFAVTDERRERAPSRANLLRAPHLKNCPLEKEEPRCPSSSWVAQRFRILKDVANLRVWQPGQRERTLTQEERARLVTLLSEQKDVPFDRMRKELGLPDRSMFNLERGSREKLEGNRLDALLAQGLGKKVWRELPEPQRAELRAAVEREEDESALRTTLSRWTIKDAVLEKLLDWEPDDRYSAYSAKALQAMLPHLEDGMDEYHARQSAYPQAGQSRVWDQLPSLVHPDTPPEICDVTNPVVRRALVELRKVVNALVREHGRPRRIVVELARELRMGSEDRRRYASDVRERGREREKARSEIEAITGGRARREDQLRYQLWREQQFACLYTGRPIAQSQVFSAEVDIDHILPRSMSLDDSRPNKVLVFSDANQRKSQRTVGEWLGVNSQEFQEILVRAEQACRHSGLPWGTLHRLQQEAVDADGFVASQLNDTRHISRMAGRYLELLYPMELRQGQQAVLTTRGGLTAELRRQWGLNSLLPTLMDSEGNDLPVAKGPILPGAKSRADHRHHAVDAVVVALSSRRRLKRYQEFHGRSTTATRTALGAPLEFEGPWEGFRFDVQAEAAKIQVSHRVMRRLAGEFHKETFYGEVKGHDGRRREKTFATRKTLEQLSAPMVRSIVDPEIRAVVEARLSAKGWTSASKELPRDWWREELRTKRGVPIRRVRIHDVVKEPVELGHRFAASSNNHSMELLDFDTGNARARVVTTLEAARRFRGGSDGHARLPKFSNAKTLSRKESVLVRPDETLEATLCVIQNISGEREPSTTVDIVLRDARDARPATESNKSPYKRITSVRALKELNAVKVQVDPLGRIKPAGD